MFKKRIEKSFGEMEKGITFAELSLKKAGGGLKKKKDTKFIEDIEKVRKRTRKTKAGKL